MNVCVECAGKLAYQLYKPSGCSEECAEKWARDRELEGYLVADYPRGLPQPEAKFASRIGSRPEMILLQHNLTESTARDWTWSQISNEIRNGCAIAHPMGQHPGEAWALVE